MANLLFGVLGLAGGSFLAVLAPEVIVNRCGSAFEKTVVGQMPAGGVCFFLGGGGIGIASFAGATAAATWSLWLALAGIGTFMLAWLTLAIWHRVAAHRT